MKVREFIFVMIDHDNKTWLEVVFEIHSAKYNQWSTQDSDIGKYVDCMSRHIRWEKLLENRVTDILKNQYFPNGKFDEYRIKKKKIIKIFEKVNLNPVPGDILYKETKLSEKYITKMVKGNDPTNWGDIHNYVKINYHHNYFLAGDDDDRGTNINLQPLGENFTLPVGSIKMNNNHKFINSNNVQNTNIDKTLNQIAQPPIVTPQTFRVDNQQTELPEFMKRHQIGGLNRDKYLENKYHQKYLRYKKKYQDLKEYI